MKVVIGKSEPRTEVVNVWLEERKGGVTLFATGKDGNKYILMDFEDEFATLAANGFDYSGLTLRQ